MKTQLKYIGNQQLKYQYYMIMTYIHPPRTALFHTWIFMQIYIIENVIKKVKSW